MRYKIVLRGIYRYRGNFYDWSEYYPWWSIWRHFVHKLGFHWWVQYSTYKECWVCGLLKSKVSGQ